MNLSQAFTQIGQWFAALAQQVLPAGGSAGQVLTKVDGTDWNVDWQTPAGGGAIDIYVDNLPGPDSTSSILLRYGDSSFALRKIGTGEYLMLPPPTIATQAETGGSTSIPIRGDFGAVLFNYDDSIYYESQALPQGKPVSFAQLGAGALKIDGMTIRCQALPVTDGVNANMTAVRFGSDVLVSGDVAASEAPPYYSGLASDFLINQNILVGDIGGFENSTGTAQQAATLHYFPTSGRTYVEFNATLSRGSFGFATGSFGFGWGFGMDPYSIALRVSGADLIAVSDSVTIATFAGEGGRGDTTARWGLLVDPTAKEWWLLADGTWLGPDPSTDPGSPYFADDFGFSRPAVEAAGTLGFCRLLFAPGMMAHAAAATAGGATQLGMLVP